MSDTNLSGTMSDDSWCGFKSFDKFLTAQGHTTPMPGWEPTEDTIQPGETLQKSDAGSVAQHSATKKGTQKAGEKAGGLVKVDGEAVTAEKDNFPKKEGSTASEVPCKKEATSRFVDGV